MAVAPPPHPLLLLLLLPLPLPLLPGVGRIVAVKTTRLCGSSDDAANRGADTGTVEPRIEPKTRCETQRQRRRLLHQQRQAATGGPS
jgi:hypothetical protein